MLEIVAVRSENGANREPAPDGHTGREHPKCRVVPFAAREVAIASTLVEPRGNGVGSPRTAETLDFHPCSERRV